MFPTRGGLLVGTPPPPPPQRTPQIPLTRHLTRHPPPHLLQMDSTLSLMIFPSQTPLSTTSPVDYKPRDFTTSTADHPTNLYTRLVPPRGILGDSSTTDPFIQTTALGSPLQRVGSYPLASTGGILPHPWGPPPPHGTSLFWPQRSPPPSTGRHTGIPSHLYMGFPTYHKDQTPTVPYGLNPPWLLLA